jgi:hypothetical protein
MFRGSLGKSAVLTTGGMCGYAFQVGETYFVYAHQSQGGLTSTICSRTRPLRDAADDLAYARSLSALVPGAPARVSGTVRAWRPPALVNGDPRTLAIDRQFPPMPGVVVTATGEGGAFTATSNQKGEFVLTGLPLGKYELIPEAPAGYAALPRRVELFDPRGCGETDLFLKHDGRVTGRVVDSRGTPIEGLALDLVPPGDVIKPGGGVNRVHAWTAADGRFEMRLVQPGEYLLGFNAFPGVDGRVTFPGAFYPGVVDLSAAGSVLVPPGERVYLRDFVVPEGIELVTVTGIVVDEQGKPVQGASVSLTDSTEGPNPIGRPVMTAGDGRFTFSLIRRGRYEVHVRRHVDTPTGTRQLQTRSVTFEAAAVASPMTIVLKPARR